MITPSWGRSFYKIKVKMNTVFQMQTENPGVIIRLGHYTGGRFLTTINARNNRTYFSILKSHHKVAYVMIKPENSFPSQALIFTLILMVT